jgi:hypothetical protein
MLTGQSETSIFFGDGDTPGIRVGADPGFGNAVVEKGPPPADMIAPDVAPILPFGVARDAFWPRSVAAWLILSTVLLILSVQFVSPTRRWRLRRGRRAARSPA